MYNTNFATNKTYRISPAYSGNSTVEAFDSGKKVLDIIISDYAIEGAEATVEAFDSGKKVLDIIISDYAIEGAEAILDSFGYRLTKRIY